MRVLIPDAESGHALAVIQSLLLRKDVKIFTMSTRKRYAARFVRQIAASELNKTPSSDEEAVDTIVRAARKFSADIVLPVAEQATGLLAQFSTYVGGSFCTIPIPKYESFQIATDKSWLARFCSENGVPHPRTYSPQEFLAASGGKPDAPDFPAIWKPVRGEGGKGIKLLANDIDLRNADCEVFKQRFGEAVVQEFIEGHDVDLSLLATNGDIVSYTIQRGILGRKSRFAASGGIEFVHLPALLDVASSLTSSLGYSGVAHLDFRLDRRDGLYKLVDMNCRFWGSLLGSLKSGVNFPWLACQAGLGETIEFNGFRESRYFDLLSVLRAPSSAWQYKINPRETNLDFWVRSPWANVANAAFRRSN